jgi:hypothetical protein
MSGALDIDAFVPADWPAVWLLLEPVFRDGVVDAHVMFKRL